MKPGRGKPGHFMETPQPRRASMHPLLKPQTISWRTALFIAGLALIAFPAIIVLSSIIAAPLHGWCA